MTASLRLAALAFAVAFCPHARANAPGSDFIVDPAHSGGAVEKFKFLYGPAIRWNGPIHWSYNHAGAPGQFSSAAVLSTLQAGMNQWLGVCGVAFVYDGPTARTPTPPDSDAADGVNVIAWGADDPYIQNANGVTVAIPLSAPDGGAYLYDADIVLDNTGRNSSGNILATVSVHEIGHMLGLAHSEIANGVMSGPPDVTYSGVGMLQPDDVRGCRCLYGPAAGQNAAYTCSLPKRFDLGSIPVGTSSVTQLFTVYNDGNAGLVVNGITGGGPDLQLGGSCAPGTFVAPGGNCTVSVSATPTSSGSFAQILTVSTSDGAYTVPALYSGRAAGVQTVDAVEFYNPSLDHYFITWIANEIAILEAGIKTHGWVRTGKHFPVYPQAQPGASPICRYYIPPGKGNSHFYGRGTVECTSTGQNNPTFVNEDPAFMYMILPAGGTCPPNTTLPVYRVFSNRADANHRYMTDPAVRDEMVAQGWLAEGDGPDRVVMCAPL